MITVCIGLLFGSKYVQFCIIFSVLYSININTIEIDPHSDSLHNDIVKAIHMSLTSVTALYGVTVTHRSPLSLPLRHNQYRNIDPGTKTWYRRNARRRTKTIVEKKQHLNSITYEQQHETIQEEIISFLKQKLLIFYHYMILSKVRLLLNCSFKQLSKNHLLLIQCYYGRKPKLN